MDDEKLFRLIQEHRLVEPVAGEFRRADACSDCGAARYFDSRE